MHLHSATEDWVTVCYTLLHTVFVAHSYPVLCRRVLAIDTNFYNSVLNPIVHFWLSYCALRRKESLCMLVRRFCISRKGWKGLTGGGSWRVTCTWWLLGLAVKVPWLEPVGPILALTVRIQDFSSKFSGLDDIGF